MPGRLGRLRASDAGWSSLAARRAHNPKVVGSNPTPATNFSYAVASRNAGAGDSAATPIKSVVVRYLMSSGPVF